MPSTYLSLHYHLVFSTKRREPMIAESWRGRFWEYLGGTIKGLHGYPQAIGGTADHIHILVGLKSTHCLAGFVRELKKSGSSWVHEETGARYFGWQEGYGAFTVSPGTRAKVRSYIGNQAEHHRNLTFREELIGLLERAGIEYDERWLD